MAEWRKLTSDPEILQTVQGYQINFLWPPVQRRVPRQVSMSKVKHKACTKEVEMMERKGTITQVDHCPGKYISMIFVVPKGSGGGGFRPVFNMKKLNHAIRDEHFKMESIQSLKLLIQRGDFMISVESEGCVFCNSNSCSASQVSSLRVGGEVTRISGLPFWDEVGSQSVHKTLKTGGVASQKDVHLDSDLLG